MKLFTPNIHFDILDHDHMYWGEPSGQQEFERLWREIFNDLQHQDGIRPEGIMPYDYEKRRNRQIQKDRQRFIDDTIFNSIKGTVVNPHPTTRLIGREKRYRRTYRPYHSPIDTMMQILNGETNDS